jgi:hypothetical protein
MNWSKAINTTKVVSFHPQKYQPTKPIIDSIYKFLYKNMINAPPIAASGIDSIKLPGISIDTAIPNPAHITYLTNKFFFFINSSI